MGVDGVRVRSSCFQVDLELHVTFCGVGGCTRGLGRGGAG